MTDYLRGILTLLPPELALAAVTIAIIIIARTLKR